MDNLNLTRHQQERLDDFDVLMLAELPDIIEDVAIMDALCSMKDYTVIQYNGMNDGISA